ADRGPSGRAAAQRIGGLLAHSYSIDSWPDVHSLQQAGSPVYMPSANTHSRTHRGILCRRRRLPVERIRKTAIELAELELATNFGNLTDTGKKGPCNSAAATLTLVSSTIKLHTCHFRGYTLCRQVRVLRRLRTAHVKH